jgi:hypothetical protein
MARPALSLVPGTGGSRERSAEPDALVA